MTDAGVRVFEIDLPAARAVFSTRHGGVSEGPYESLNLGILTDDEPERVAENRGRLAGRAGLDPSRVAMGWQVHGAAVHRWESAPARSGYASPGAELPRVDAHVTDVPGLGLLVLAADCLPIALACPGRVAMLHCGWRGLAAGLIERALEDFDTEPAAAIGPGIGPCCYEVGPEVLAQFEGQGRGDASPGALDLRAMAREKLERAGVARLEEVALCTSCRGDLFFSHRRDGGVTGRQGGMVWRTA